MNETKPKEIDLSTYDDVVKLMDERTDVQTVTFAVTLGMLFIGMVRYSPM